MRTTLFIAAFLSCLTAFAQPATTIRALDNLLAWPGRSGETIRVETGLGTNDWEIGRAHV